MWFLITASGGHVQRMIKSYTQYSAHAHTPPSETIESARDSLDTHRRPRYYAIITDHCGTEISPGGDKPATLFPATATPVNQNPPARSRK